MEYDNACDSERAEVAMAVEPPQRHCSGLVSKVDLEESGPAAGVAFRAQPADLLRH